MALNSSPFPEQGRDEISRAGGLSIINPRLYWDVVSLVVVVRRVSRLCRGVGVQRVLPSDAVSGRSPASPTAWRRRSLSAPRLVVDQRPLRDATVRRVSDATNDVCLGRRRRETASRRR